MPKKKDAYAEAGVSIDAGNRFVEMIRPMVKAASRPEVLTEIGGFGGLFGLRSDKYKNPVLVSSTDGVGTKLKIAFMMDRHDTVGIDLVAMCVNDVVVQGAEPLFFLDYFATGKLHPEKAAQVIKGVAEGCKDAGCALIGGETAEMPSFYNEGEYDIAGFTVGIVDQDNLIDGSSINVGNKIIGIASSGLHSNGYSLVRKVCFEKLKLKIDDNIPELGKSIGEELLTPTRIYVKSILHLVKEFKISGMAHITGGGFTENIPRVVPKSCKARINIGSWDMPPIFTYLKDQGGLSDEEMLRTFNNGIGMVMVVKQELVDDIMIRLNGLKEKAWVIGDIVERKEGEGSIEYA
ncbi:MAG: phosphoribosylformylglycinamidine cyclo-ligase [Deltaproteobacteria bacterium]|nr:phosphoribosylformylglycinamidine cyclo-ligase [Deltaproteobacteria bacterium]